MSRKFCEPSLVLATHNKGKIAEISALLDPYVSTFLSAGELGLLEPEETGETFRDNAVLKALASAKESGHVALADDSGLCVYALGGEPGVYSARWAGPGKDFPKAMQKVHERLGENPDRRAAFVCVLALAWPDGHVETAEGRCEGEIVWPPRGAQGFGYDPFFVPDGYDESFAQMDRIQKQALSHRGKAFATLLELCFH